MGYHGAHFATFPIELPLRCIKASTSKVGVCSKCGKPWSRVIENAFVPQQDVAPENNHPGIGNQKPMDESNGWQGAPRGSNDSKTIEWRPSCRCNAPAVPSIVLDPFAGSGTTLAAAKSLGHIGIGYELSTEYLPMIRQRLQETPEGKLSCQLSFVLNNEVKK